MSYSKPCYTDRISKKDAELPLLPTAQERQMAPSAATARTGKIIFDTQGRECRQVLFDNQTGKTVSTEVPCDNAIAQDNKRAPIAEGTMRRIESISRSFAR